LRDCRKEIDGRCYPKNSIQSRDFKYPADLFAHVHELKADASRFSLLTQFQHCSQSGGVNCGDPRQIEFDYTGRRQALHRIAQNLRFTGNNLTLQAQHRDSAKVFGV
jgi:hypothetical protein